MMGDHDITFADDTPKLRYKKKHTMQAIRQHGEGLKHAESMTLSFGFEMLEKFQNYHGKCFDPYEIFRRTMGSILMANTYDHSTQEDVDKFSKVLERFTAAMKPSGPNILLDICPSLRFLSTRLRTSYDEIVAIGNDFEEILGPLTEARKANRKVQNPKIFIDHFLDLSDPNSNNDKNMVLNHKDIIFIAMNLLTAGIETTSFLLTNLLGILVNHADIQDQSYREITKAIGKRAPTTEDRECIPYIDALILEAFRYTAMTPLSLPHYSGCDSELGGFFIPKGTIILPNIWSLHHDEKYWDHPWDFDPLRFLENGKLLPVDHIKRQRLLPFSAGRRQCPAEVFSSNRLFILVALLIQKFKVLVNR